MTTKRMDGFTLGELFSEIGRRRAARRGGYRRSCECGKCATCKKRIAQAKWRGKAKAAA